MICLKPLAAFLLLLGSIIAAEKTDYTGHKLIQVTPKTEKHIRLLGQWHHEPDFDVWNRIKGLNNEVDISLSPSAYEKYKPLFDAYDFTYRIVNNNIQNMIDEETMTLATSRLLNNDPTRIAGTFARHTNINIWLEQIAVLNNKYASTYVAGRTLENREMKVLLLKTANSKRAIWIDCGIHAREWISPSTCIWFIDRLTREYNAGDAIATAILDYYEIHILPVHNPDGYEFSHTNTRLWRKNRKINSGSTCVGVDLNRNFGYQWMVAGASSSPCSDTYAGASANDQLETQAVQKIINSQITKWDAFLTIHTYGQWFFTEWSYTTALPKDYAVQKQTADFTAAVIKSVNNTVFTCGSTGNLLYLAAGCSSDWAYGTANILHSYTIELRPSSTSPDASYGFMLPVDRAPLVGEEMYVGLKALLNYIKK